MDEIDEFEKTLEEYKKQVMEASFTNLNKLIEKYGSDIHDDWVFMYLTAAFFSKHENLWGGGKYEKELSPINNKIDAILKKYGLECVEEFNPGDKPPEIDKLLKDYVDLLDRKLVDLFKKHDLKKFAEFYSTDKEKYLERYQEIKRNHNSSKLQLSEIVRELEQESKKCADIRAFNAATILIGSAIEGVMLDVAQKDSKFLRAFKKRGKNKLEIISLSLSQLISLFIEAKIYPFDDDKNGLQRSMLEIAGHIRNLIHPGRKIKAKFTKITEQEYIFLESIYLNLISFYYR